MFDVEEFVEQCRAARREATPHKAIEEVLERTLSEPGAVCDALAEEWAQATPLYADDDLTVLHVVWAPGMQIRAHNHHMWAAIGLYAGQEDNTFYRREGSGIAPAGGRELHARDVALLGRNVIHAVTNPRRTYTGAIHVYGGNLTTQAGRSEWDESCEIPYDFGGTRRYFDEANRS